MYVKTNAALDVYLAVYS